MEYKNKGGKIILFTCRSDEDLVVALNTCSQNGLEFDAVNTDMQSTIDAWRIKRPHSSISPKPYVDMYIDDKAYPSCVKGIDWAMLSIELLKEE